MKRRKTDEYCKAGGFKYCIKDESYYLDNEKVDAIEVDEESITSALLLKIKQSADLACCTAEEYTKHWDEEDWGCERNRIRNNVKAYLFALSIRP